MKKKVYRKEKTVLRIIIINIEKEQIEQSWENEKNPAQLPPCQYFLYFFLIFLSKTEKNTLLHTVSPTLTLLHTVFGFKLLHAVPCLSHKSPTPCTHHTAGAWKTRRQATSFSSHFTPRTLAGSLALALPLPSYTPELDLNYSMLSPVFHTSPPPLARITQHVLEKLGGKPPRFPRTLGPEP